MTPITLDQIGLRWQDHKSALWWIGLTYRQPSRMYEVFEELSPREGIRSGVILWFHVLPYIVCFSIVGRLAVYAFSDIATPILSQAIWLALSMIMGLAILISLYVLTWKLEKEALGFVFVYGFPFGIMMAIIGGIFLEISAHPSVRSAILLLGCIGIGVMISIGVGAIDFPPSRKIRWQMGGFFFFYTLLISAVAQATIIAKISFWLILVAVSGIFVLRLYNYAIHTCFLILKLPSKYYRYHPVAWDDLCLFPFAGLHRLLVAVAEEIPGQESEIERLIASYPSQLHQALHSKATLLARKAGQVTDLSKLDKITAQLPTGEKFFLSQTQELCAWVNEISLLQTRLNTINRSAFREPTAELLIKEIENFRHRIAGLHEPLATEFRGAATQWLVIAERQLDEARRGATKELTPQVFRAGDPVDQEHEAFVPRYAVIGEMEQQVMLSTGCPGIVLYGRRRMGKSTILRNMTGFLPTDVVTAFFSMQKPHLFTSLESAVRVISHEIQQQLPASNIGADSVADLRGFYDLLTRCNEQLEADGKRLMLAVDEYENIDTKIGEGVFPLDLLDTIRESIQTHRHITWIFAGSHEIYELKNASWTSHLVSARTIEVPSFTLDETRLLLTEPLKHSSLWRDNEAKRPRFDTSFWGEGGIQRIHSEAGGWPHLVQLIVETIVDVLNNEEASKVTPELMERALDKSIVSGQIVLYQLMHDESKLPGEWDYLSNFRKTETQPPPQDEKIAASLRRRLLIEELNGEWRLRVPLMARWLKQRG